MVAGSRVLVHVDMLPFRCYVKRMDWFIRHSQALNALATVVTAGAAVAMFVLSCVMLWVQARREEEIKKLVEEVYRRLENVILQSGSLAGHDDLIKRAKEE